MAYNDRDQQVSAQRQFLIKVRGLDGRWAQKTGGELSSATSKVWDGGRKKPAILSSPPEMSDITLTRPYHTFRDDNTLRFLRDRVGTWRTTITEQPTNVDLDRVGKPVVYSEALLTNVSGPDVDASSGEGGMISITFAVGTWN